MDVSPRTGKLEMLPLSDSSRVCAGVITVDSPHPPASLKRSLCLLSSLSTSSSSKAILDEQRDTAAAFLSDETTDKRVSPHVATETSAVVDTLGTLAFSDGSYTLGPEQLDITGAPISLEFCIAANHTRVHSRVRVIVKLRLIAVSIREEDAVHDETEDAQKSEEDEMSLDVFGVRVVREDWIAPSVAVKARRDDIVKYALEQGSSGNLQQEQSLPWMSSTSAEYERRWAYSQTRADVLEDSDSEDDDEDEEEEEEEEEEGEEDNEQGGTSYGGRHKAIWSTFRGEMSFSPPNDALEAELTGTGVILPHSASLELAPLPELV